VVDVEPIAVTIWFIKGNAMSIFSWLIVAGVVLLAFAGGLYYWMNRKPSVATGFTSTVDAVALAACKAAARGGIWVAIQNAAMADDTAMAVELLDYYARIGAWKMPDPLPAEPIVAVVSDSTAAAIEKLTAQLAAQAAEIAALKQTGA